jgi:hypothetical protein
MIDGVGITWASRVEDAAAVVDERVVDRERYSDRLIAYHLNGVGGSAVQQNSEQRMVEQDMSSKRRLHRALTTCVTRCRVLLLAGRRQKNLQLTLARSLFMVALDCVKISQLQSLY